MRPKWKCLAIMYTFVENQITAWWWREGDLSCFCSHRTWALVSHWVDYKHICISKWAVLESNVRTSVQQLKLDPNWVMQQDNGTKQSSKSMNGWKTKDVDVKELWSLIEMLLQNLKRDVHRRMPRNLNELQECCKERVSHNFSTRRKKLIHLYRKHFLHVILAKGRSTHYWNMGCTLFFAWMQRVLWKLYF